MSSETDARVADYVLGLMESEEAVRFERRMKADPALAHEVARGIEAFHAMDETAAPQTPSASLWQRIERSLAERAAGRAEPRPRIPALWQNLAFWRWSGIGGVGLSGALAAALAAFVLKPLPAPQFIAILQSEDGAATGAVVEVDASGRARLIPLQDIPVPAGRALEVWTLQSRKQGPVSVALINSARQAELAVGKLPPARSEQLFEITLEPATGSPIGRPTGPVLFKGLTVKAR